MFIFVRSQAIIDCLYTRSSGGVAAYAAVISLLFQVTGYLSLKGRVAIEVTTLEP
jgi:hypothetical protein